LLSYRTLNSKIAYRSSCGVASLQLQLTIIIIGLKFTYEVIHSIVELILKQSPITSVFDVSEASERRKMWKIVRLAKSSSSAAVMQQPQSLGIANSTRLFTEFRKPEVVNALKQGITVIDVRQPEEIVETGSLKAGNGEAKNIPLGELQAALAMSDSDFKKRYKFDKPKPTQEVIFSCRSGKRSANASTIAESVGYTKVTNYIGGAIDWFQ
jgi:rhodanese-related sulfurtransferase